MARRNKVAAELMQKRGVGADPPTEADIDAALEEEGEGVGARGPRVGRQVGAPSPALPGWDSSEAEMSALGAAAPGAPQSPAEGAML